MKIKNLLKTAGIVFLADVIENFILLAFFSVPFSKQTIIGTLVLTALLTLILKQTNIIKND